MHVTPTNSSDQQQQFDVVVIAEKFGGAQLPEGAAPWPLQKLGPFTLLELCLEWVSWFDSPNVIVATTGSLDEKDSQAVERRWNHSHAFDGKLRVLPFANCHSGNDVLREVESRRLLSSGGNFILVDNVATLCSSNLERQLTEFAGRLKQNKNNVMTILLTPAPTIGQSHRTELRTLVGYERKTGRLISYSRVGEDDREGGSRLPIPKERFLSESFYRSDLRPCGIYFCAHSLLSHFSGNYDLQTLDGIVEDILHNEEFLAQNIHVEVVEALPIAVQAVTEANVEGTEKKAAAVVVQQPLATTSTRIQCATNYAELLLELQQRLIERYSFPLTFDNVLPFFKDFDRLKCRASANVYTSASSVEDPFAGRSNVENSVFGKGTEVHSSATVGGSVFGANAKIGKNSVVKRCLFGDFARVGDNCRLEECVFGPKAVVGSGVCLTGMCLLSSGSRVLSSDDPGKLPSLTDYSNKSCATGDGGIRGEHTTRNKRNREEKDEEEDGAGSSDEEGGAVGGAVDVIYQGNTANFLAEVTESMRSLVVSSSMENGVISSNDGASLTPQLSGAQKERVEKMKLEINASKLAYNISIEELSRGIFLAFLRLPQVTGGGFAQLARAFKEWQPLWRNYYKKDANKTELLHAVEEFALANDAFQRMLPKFLHFLYDTEDFLPDDVILDWFKKLPADSPLLKITKLKELVDWIADDDDDDDEEEEENGDADE